MHLAAAFLVVSLGVSVAPAIAQVSSDSARVSHLFVIASEGSVRYQSMVQPAKDTLAMMGAKAAPWLAQRLSTSDARERLTLADIFEKMGKVATPFIIPYLDSAGEDFPRNAARALTRIKDTAAVPALLAHMDHPNFSVRSDVATALGKTGDRRAGNVLVQHLLDDADGDVRKSCAVALGLIGDKNNAPALYTALDDEFYGVRQTALISIEQLNPEPIWMSQPIPSAQHRATRTPLGFGVRASLIVSLGISSDKKARKYLAESLNSHDPMDRGFAIEALGLKPTRESAKVVARMKTRENDPFVLAQIARFEEIYSDSVKPKPKS